MNSKNLNEKAYYPALLERMLKDYFENSYQIEPKICCMTAASAPLLTHLRNPDILISWA